MITRGQFAELVIGWDVTTGFDPKYWLHHGAAPGEHQQEMLVKIPAQHIAYHTVIIAQSGSGKSFFLGRLLEEILIKTECRVFIFDPNSDFRKMTDVVDPDRWSKKAGYEPIRRRGFLPDEKSKEEFERKWKKVKKNIFSMKGDNTTRLKIDWSRVSIDIISEGLDPTSESELRHCHDFVRVISDLMVLTQSAEWRDSHPLLDYCRKLCEETRGLTDHNIGLRLRDIFGKPITPEKIALPELRRRLQFPHGLNDLKEDSLRKKIEELHQKAAVYRGFVGDTMEKFYFSSAYAVRESGLLRKNDNVLTEENDARLQVVDLPSIEDGRFRRLAVSTLLAAEWARCRRDWERELRKRQGSHDRRVPTFIVVDEAHNLIPETPRNHSEVSLREQFRTVAAEGRKFGLFLILVSQRPDKLDPLVLSECENRAIMKIGSASVLKKTSEALGLGDFPIRTLERCLEFDVGRALLVGTWAPKVPTFLYTAARRTEEGGKNLDDHWARQPLPQEEGSDVPAGETPKPGVSPQTGIGRRMPLAAAQQDIPAAATPRTLKA